MRQLITTLKSGGTRWWTGTSLRWRRPGAPAWNSERTAELPFARGGEPVRRSPVSRRAMLLGGVASTATGVGGLLGSATAHATPAMTGELPPGTAFDVRTFGAVGDGRTDETAALQRALDAAKPGGGVVFVPPGVYLTRRLRLYSRVHLRGAGGDLSVLRLHAGANSAILETDGFDELTGTRGSGGAGYFSVRDLTLDGNKAANERGGYGLRIYGYGYELTEVIVQSCREDGVYTEWGSAAALPAPSHQMEARLTAVRAHDNEGHGLNINGPHDSMFVNCLAFENKAIGFRLAGDSSGASLVNCHGWGIRQNVAFDLAAPAISCVNCYADLNGGVGVRISRRDCRWVGGTVLGGNHDGPGEEIGIQFVAGLIDNEPSGAVIDTKIMNCATAAVDFGADRGLSTVRANLWQPGVLDKSGRQVAGTGRGWIGTPDPATRVELTQGLGGSGKNLVVEPSFVLRPEPPPTLPLDGVRLFAREEGGKTQLCAQFPSGGVHVIAAE